MAKVRHGPTLVVAALWLGICGQQANAGQLRAVVELFTSQGCSSCPPAEALVGRLSAAPAVLVLLFHVDYWDQLGWKDRFSSTQSTDRQYAYASSLRAQSVFTPQVIVNGSESLIGSQEKNALDAVAAERRTGFSIQANLVRQPDGRFAVTLVGQAIAAEVWEVRYVRRSATVINAGENGGRTLNSVDDVTRIRRIGTYPLEPLYLEPLSKPDDALAVLVQAPNAGRILGAAAYPL